MASVNWKQLIECQPHELVLSGKSGAKEIEDEKGVSELLFKISSLNFLEISTCGLVEVPSKIEDLSSLTNLVLHGNRLTHLPPAVGKLKKLKLLDVSRNELRLLPDELSQLSELQSLLVSGNQLDSLPSDLTLLSSLLVVKIDQNNFTHFPLSLLNEENPKVSLTEVHAQKNKIVSIPATINRLVSLKVLDLRENSLTVIPGELGDCTKLKELSLEGNKLSDRRFLKLVEQKKSKQVMDYIRAHFPRGESGEKGKGGEPSRDRRSLVKEARRGRRSTSRSSRGNSECLMDTIRVLTVREDAWVTVTSSPPALEQRKIVACIVRDVDLSREGILKRFLQLQTTLHDGVCGKRTLATIAAHDLEKISGKISFDVRPPGKVRLLPLNRTKEMSASELYRTLMDEAENVRKEKKRNTFSGIHKYLYLLKGKSRYSCLIDSDGNIISFPPITNSHNTRVLVSLSSFWFFQFFRFFPFFSDSLFSPLSLDLYRFQSS